MSTTGLLMGLVLIGAIAALVAAPFFRRDPGDRSADAQLQKQRERLLVVYDRILANIRDLDEDHNTGKMPDDTYQQERELWVQRGIEALKALDGLSGNELMVTETPEIDAIDSAIDQHIEAAVAAYRTKAGRG